MGRARAGPPGAAGGHGGYRDTREVVKKTKKNQPWEPTPEPARAGWASLKLLDPAQIVTAVTASRETQAFLS